MSDQIRLRDAKLIPIGNSRGIRIPKALLQKYGLKDTLLIEETDRGLLLRNKEEGKLSWEDTYKAMAGEKEHWEDFDATIGENPAPDQMRGSGSGNRSGSDPHHQQAAIEK